ncbi:hypothetical protein FRC07_010940, partial [Ceratobasidium sp. 392]
METPERLHIEFAKQAYKATNHKNFFEQMVVYLDRRERVNKFDAYLRYHNPEYAERELGLEKDFRNEPSAPGWKLAIKSPLPPIPASVLPETHDIKWFKYSVEEYFRKFHQRNVEFEDDECLEVFPKATQVINDAFAKELVNQVHASPARRNGPTKSRFDTVLVRKGITFEPGQLNVPSYGIT